MSQFIDIHTHQPDLLKDDCISIQNKLLHETSHDKGNKISVGWHPWHLNEYPFDEMKSILHFEGQSENVIAIGECGLDRACKTDFQLQLEVFREHLYTAKETSKPLIIHCVRAYSDLMEIIKKEKFNGNFIIHDYWGNEPQTKELMKYKSWFSFGKSILGSNNKLVTTFRSIPLSRFFLETDNANHTIEEIYHQASKIRSLEIEELKVKIEENYYNCFGQTTIPKWED